MTRTVKAWRNTHATISFQPPLHCGRIHATRCAAAAARISAVSILWRVALPAVRARYPVKKEGAVISSARRARAACQCTAAVRVTTRRTGAARCCAYQAPHAQRAHHLPYAERRYRPFVHILLPRVSLACWRGYLCAARIGSIIASIAAVRCGWAWRFIFWHGDDARATAGRDAALFGAASWYAGVLWRCARSVFISYAFMARRC